MQEEIKKPDCPHDQFSADVQVVKFGPETALALVKIKCSGCGQWVQFSGVETGMSLECPSKSKDGTLAHLPLTLTSPTHEHGGTTPQGNLVPG